MAGYDLYIERPDGSAIGSADFVRIVEGGSGWVRANGRADAGDPVAEFTNHSGHDIAFYPVEGGVLIRGGTVDEDDLRELIVIAVRLGGRLVGSDGEVYGPNGMVPGT